MARTFGGSIGSAEADICAANYIRHRVAAVSDVVQRMLETLEARAQEFMESGERGIREVVKDEGQSQGVLAAVTAYLAQSEPDAEQVALCNRMIMDAGAADELQTVLWLIGEELALPTAAEARPAPQPQSQHVQPAKPAAAAAPRQAVQQRQQAAERRVQAPQQARPQAAAQDEAVDPDEFFGVAVPAREVAKARLIVADARARAAGDGRYEDSPYVSGRGLNAWQPKLLKAAFSAAEEAASAAAGGTAEVVEEGAGPDEEISAEVVEDAFYGDDGGSEAMEADAPEGLFAEQVDDERDDAAELTLPLQPPPRPQPTVLHAPSPASRTSPPPVRPASGAGLMSSHVRPAAPPLPPRR
jgi:hypothetical protein